MGLLDFIKQTCRENRAYYEERARHAPIVFTPKKPKGNYSKETKAQDLIFYCKFCANKLNLSNCVSTFEDAYTELLENLQELAWSNEKDKVFMTPTPRQNFEKMQANMNATLNDLIFRAKIEGLSSTDREYRLEYLEQFVFEFKNSDLISRLATEENISNAERLYEEGKEVYESLKRGREIERRKKVLNMVGVEKNLNLSDYDPMDVIKAMESRMDSTYRSFMTSALSAEQGERLYKEFEDACTSSQLPLMAEVRLESLLNEYKPKFSVPNPLSIVDEMEGHQFEYWCANLLKRNGFTNVEVTPGSNDQGVDVLAEKGGIKYAIQCKCYSSDLSNKPVQEVNTGKAIYRCQIGVVMTNRYFTAGAKQAAEATGVLLWDREKLKEMLN